MRSVGLRLALASIALLSAVPLATNFTRAQRSAIDTYAITNARIVTMADPVIERGTVVIRNGLITQVGASVTAPPDARVIDGAGLTIYPGIIDANTNLGMPDAAPSPSPGGGAAAFLLAQARPPTSPSGPNSTQPVGLQPEVMAEDMFRATSDQLDSAKNIGITTVLSVPRGGIWMGQSALVNLAGETPQQMTVRSPVAMHVGFAPLRGVYPNSLLGVFSALRQMLLDAQNYRESKQIYERSPRGLRRPALDRSLEALLPVLDGRMPVVFHADREREIRRALDLAEEFKLKAVIAGGSEAWKVTDRLKKADVPVLLSLNFPRRTTAAMAQADPEPLRVLRDRVEAPKTAAKLAAAKVRFAFQSGAMTISDFLPNAGKTVESGLLKDEAIRALTLRPAEIFGVADRLGTIEAGKIANLTVVRGDLFDRNSRVAHVFIDGKPVDLRPAPARPAAGEAATTGAPSASSLAGNWNITITLGAQTLPGTLVLNQEGNNIAGSLQTTLASTQFSNGTAEGNSFRATMTATIQGQSMDLTLDGRVTGNEISGTIGGTFGVATFTGTRPR